MWPQELSACKRMSHLYYLLKKVKVAFYSLLYMCRTNHVSATLQSFTPGHRVCTFQMRSQLPGEHTALTPIKRPEQSFTYQSLPLQVLIYSWVDWEGLSGQKIRPWRESNPQLSGLQPNTLTTRPLDPLIWAIMIFELRGWAGLYGRLNDLVAIGD